MKDVRTETWMLLVVAIAFVARLYHLDVQSLWFDEIVTVALAHLSWYNGLVGLLGQGIQLTPLFHWVIKLWLTVGDSDWLVRAPTMLVGILTVPIVFKLGQFYFGNTVGLLTAFIFAINPYQVWYGQEVKLYTLLVFASSGAILAFGQMLRSEGRQGVWSMMLFNLLGFTAHYFMFLISTVQFLYLASTIKQTHLVLRRWIMAQVIPVLALIPWWLFIIKQQHFAVGIGWIPRPRWFDPLLTLWNFSFGYTGELSIITLVSLAVMALGLIMGLGQAWRRPLLGWLMTLWLVFPPAITLLLSFHRLSFYVDRYLLIISPVSTLLIVCGLLSIRPWLLRWGVSLVFVVATLFGLGNVYFNPVNFNKDDWRTLARKVDLQAQPGDMVITCTDGYRLAFEYYHPHHILTLDDVLTASQISDAVRSTHYRAAWVVNLHYRPPVHNLTRDFLPILDTSLLSPEAAAWEAHNLRDKITVAGITAYRYDLVDPLPLPEIVTWYCQNDQLWENREFFP